MELEPLIIALVTFAALVTLAIVQGCRRAENGAGRAAHGAATGFLVLLASAPITLVWLFALWNVRLPVAPPDTPGGIACNGDDSLTALTIVIVLVLHVIVVRGLPFVVGFLVGYVLGNRRPERGLPDGRLALRATALAAGGLGLIAAVRLLAGGVAPEAFHTYGAITPDRGVRGWRADWTIDRARQGPLEEMKDGPPIASEAVYVGTPYRGDMPLPISESHWKVTSGAKIWVAGEPVLVAASGTEPPVLRRVGVRSEFPPERRAHFQTRPRVAPARDGWLLVERRPDGRRFAVLVDQYGGERAAMLFDAGPLLAAPWWPLLPTGVVVGIVVLLIYAPPRQRPRPLRFLAAAWLLAEVAIALFVIYRPYV